MRKSTGIEKMFSVGRHYDEIPVHRIRDKIDEYNRLPSQ
jgi:hypothetical protein